MHLVLTRDTYTKHETLGVLEIAGQRFQTIEPPWVPGNDPGEDGGEPGKSCVREGIYALVPHDTVKHPRTFALVNPDLDVVHNPTPGKRSDVLIHSANWARELEGCIAPGQDRERDGEVWMVTHSKASLRTILSLMPWEAGHTIEIRKSTVGEQIA